MLRLAKTLPALAIAGFCLTAVNNTPVQAAQCVTGVASWDRLNVRSGPSTRYPVVFSLRHNQCGVSNPRTCRGNWCKISFRGTHGWANSRFLYRDEGDGQGGGVPRPRVTRFNLPSLHGVRVDSRLTAYSGFSMARAARRFCAQKGYRRMVTYRVATAYRTMAMNDSHIFHNRPNSNTAFRYITCR